jgi:hypothetical protein
MNLIFNTLIKDYLQIIINHLLKLNKHKHFLINTIKIKLLNNNNNNQPLIIHNLRLNLNLKLKI